MLGFTSIYRLFVSAVIVFINMSTIFGPELIVISHSVYFYAALSPLIE